MKTALSGLSSQPQPGAGAVVLAALLWALPVVSAVWAVDNAGSLEALPFAQLTDRNQSALGRAALAITPGDWKHAETEHFVYHYISSHVATPASVQAEFYFRVISKDLGKEKQPWERKSHIYIFEEDDAWNRFKTQAKLDPWTGGINVGDELFLQRDPSYKWEGNTLGHEITHLLLNRFYPNQRLPLWLNEGYSEYISKLMYVAFYRARGYDARPRSAALAPHEFMPLSRLFSTRQYPQNPAMVRTFYLQSEKLVWFLHSVDETDKAFIELMDQAGKGVPFQSALNRIYRGHFSSLTDLETQFKAYATRHAKNSAGGGADFQSKDGSPGQTGGDGKTWMIDR